MSRLVLTAHGILSKGQWEQAVRPVLEAWGFEHRTYPLPWWRLPWLLKPLHMWEAKCFRNWYAENATSRRPILIGHSFGGFLVYKTLHNEEFRAHRVVLTSPPIPASVNVAALRHNPRSVEDK